MTTKDSLLESVGLAINQADSDWYGNRGGPDPGPWRDEYKDGLARAACEAMLRVFEAESLKVCQMVWDDSNGGQHIYPEDLEVAIYLFAKDHGIPLPILKE